MSDSSPLQTEQAVQLPIKITLGDAAEIAERLERGETAMVKLDPDDVPFLPEQIQWQLENPGQIMEFVDEYDGPRRSDQ